MTGHLTHPEHVLAVKTASGARRSRAVGLLAAMLAWSVFAVGGAYVWGGAPIIAAAALLAVVARPRPAAASETGLLDTALVAGLLLAAVPLVPLPPSARSLLSPQADAVRSALSLLPDAGWRPLSLAPGATAYALGLIAAAVIVFWSARQTCGRGATRSLAFAIAAIGLVAALVALLSRSGDPRLIYGRWLPQDEEARPFGPFVNRNHFATWILMAFPLAAGHVAARIAAHRPRTRVGSEVAAWLRALGSTDLWAAVAGAVMTLSLIAAASRSGLIALGAALACGVWIARRRFGRLAWLCGLAGLGLLGVVIMAYANFEPVLLRIEETIDSGAGARPAIWRESARIARDFWLVGTGLGGFQTAMLVYQQMDRAWFINQAHNQYLQWLAEGGLLLAVPALVALVAFVRLFLARLARDTSALVWLRVGGAMALVGAAVQGIWETGLRMPANGLLFAMAAAIAVHRPEDAGPHESSE